LSATGAGAAGRSTGSGFTSVSPSSSVATGAKLRAGAASGGLWAGGRTLASSGGNGAANGVIGASRLTRTTAAGASRVATTLGCGTGSGAGASSAAGARLCTTTGPCIKTVRPFCPSSAKKPGYAGECAVAPTGGTEALGTAVGAAAGKEAADSHAGGTGAGGEAGFAGGAAAAGLAAGSGATGFARGAAAAGLAAGSGATGFARGAADWAAGSGATGWAGGGGAAGFAGDAAGWAAGGAAGDVFG